MTYLDLALLPTGCLAISFSDATRDMLPQFPALELVHALKWANRDLLLR